MKHSAIALSLCLSQVVTVSSAALPIKASAEINFRQEYAEEYQKSIQHVSSFYELIDALENAEHSEIRFDNTIEITKYEYEYLSNHPMILNEGVTLNLNTYSLIFRDQVPDKIETLFTMKDQSKITDRIGGGYTQNSGIRFINAIFKGTLIEVSKGAEVSLEGRISDLRNQEDWNDPTEKSNWITVRCMDDTNLSVSGDIESSSIAVITDFSNNKNSVLNIEKSGTIGGGGSPKTEYTGLYINNDVGTIEINLKGGVGGGVFLEGNAEAKNTYLNLDSGFIGGSPALSLKNSVVDVNGGKIQTWDHITWDHGDAVRIYHDDETHSEHNSCFTMFDGDIWGEIKLYKPDGSEIVDQSEIENKPVRILRGTIFFFPEFNSSYIDSNSVDEVLDTLNQYGRTYHRVSLKPGWYDSEDGLHKMYLEEGQYIKDVKYRIDGKDYYFDENGYLMTGVFKIGLHWEQADENGVIQGFAQGFKKVAPTAMFFNEKGIPVCNQEKVIEGNTYYFGEDGLALTGTHKMNGYIYTFNEEGFLISKVKDSGQTSDKDPENPSEPGKIPDDQPDKPTDPDKPSKPQKPDQNIDNGQWTTDANGYLQYFVDGKPVSKGWYQITGKDYYFYPDGTVATGTVQIGGKWYNFNARTGAYEGVCDGFVLANPTPRYYENGTLVCNEWKKINNNWYYFGANGYAYAGIQMIEGKQYEFRENGVLVREIPKKNDPEQKPGDSQNKPEDPKQDPTPINKNGLSVNSSSIRYYVNDKPLTLAWKTIGNSSYYFGADGNAVRGRVVIEGKTYLFDDNGTFLRELVSSPAGTKPSNPANLGSTGSNQPAKPSGAVKPVLRNGKWVLQDDSGKTVINTWYQGSLGSGNKSWYYFDETGNPVQGWKQITYNGSPSWFLFDSDGKMQSGWNWLDGDWYYLGSDGAMQTGWVKDQGTWYYTDSAGKMKTGWMKLEWNGRTDWYYFRTDGSMLADGTLGQYRFDSAGICLNPEA